MSRDKPKPERAPTFEDRLAAMEAELSTVKAENAVLRERVQHVVAELPDGDIIDQGQFIDDPTRLVGLDPGLVPYWATPKTEWKLIQYGYRKAMPSDFVQDPNDPEMTPAKLHKLAITGGIGGAGHILYVCSREHRQKRADAEHRRTLAASRDTMNPSGRFRDPHTGRSVMVTRGLHGHEKRTG
jgi:hypothetical protein